MKDNGWMPDIGLTIKEFRGGGRGFTCSKAIKPHSVLVSIPITLIASRKTVLRNGSLVASLLKESPSAGHLPTQTLLSLFLLHEKRLAGQSWWRAYVNTLPLRYDTPYFCTRRELDTFPDYLQQAAHQSREVVEKEFARAQNLVRGKFKFSLSSFAWAWFTVNTRAVYLKDSNDGENCLALAPYLDMFNHTFDTIVEAGINLRKVTGQADVYQIVTHSRFAAYDQVFINYGPHDNLKLFLEYGFTLSGNPHDRVPLSLDDILRHVGIARANLNDKVTFIMELKLSHNLGITREGLTWNALAIVRILLLPSFTGQSDGLRDDVLDFDPAAVGRLPVVHTIIDDRLNMILNSIAKLCTLKNVTSSAQVALGLLKCHQVILADAKNALSENDEENTRQ